MPQYRVFAWSKTFRIVGAPEVIDCADDAEAIAQAHQRLDGHAIEVWDGPRMVVRLEPEKDHEPPAKPA